MVSNKEVFAAVPGHTVRPGPPNAARRMVSGFAGWTLVLHFAVALTHWLRPWPGGLQAQLDRATTTQRCDNHSPGGEMVVPGLANWAGVETTSMMTAKLTQTFSGSLYSSPKTPTPVDDPSFEALIFPLPGEPAEAYGALHQALDPGDPVDPGEPSLGPSVRCQSGEG